jgi:hypothetical protein
MKDAELEEFMDQFAEQKIKMNKEIKRKYTLKI